MQVGKRMPKWYADAFKLPPVERAKLRNRTFQGIADAMAEQWGGGGNYTKWKSRKCKKLKLSPIN